MVSRSTSQRVKPSEDALAKPAPLREHDQAEGTHGGVLGFPATSGGRGIPPIPQPMHVPEIERADEGAEAASVVAGSGVHPGYPHGPRGHPGREHGAWDNASGDAR